MALAADDFKSFGSKKGQGIMNASSQNLNHEVNRQELNKETV